MSTCENLESSPLSGGVRNQANSSPPTTIREVQAKRGSNLSPATNPSSELLRESSGAPTMQKGHSKFAKEIGSYWVCPRDGVQKPLVEFQEELTKISWAPALCSTAPGRQRGIRSNLKEPLNVGRKGGRGQTSPSTSPKASPPAPVICPGLPAGARRFDLHEGNAKCD